MLLAYSHCAYPDKLSFELCLIPDKPDDFGRPMPLSLIEVTESAVLKVGAGESCLIRPTNKDGAIVIDPIKPAKIYLTLDRPDQPGFAVKTALLRKEGSVWRISYQRVHPDDPWIAWEPLEANFG
jgi:hypothetical protein